MTNSKQPVNKWALCLIKMLSPSDFKTLSQLLKVEEESSSDEDLPRTGYMKMGPGDIGKRTKVEIRGQEGDKSMPTDPKAIWEPEEVPEVAACNDVHWDPRDKPSYDVVYKQAVRSEDIFLQMSNKTAATASCESMVIRMVLEGDSKEVVDCHVTKTSLDVRSPRYPPQSRPSSPGRPSLLHC